MEEANADPQGRLERIVRRLLGKAHVARLQHLDALKSEAEWHARKAALHGLGTYPDGSSAADCELRKHDNLALSFNAGKYWWMAHMRLKQGPHDGLIYRLPTQPPNA